MKRPFNRPYNTRITDQIVISFFLSYTNYGKKTISIKAKNNLSTSPQPLTSTVQVMGDIGHILTQLHPAPTVENVLKIATKQQFEIDISLSVKQAVNYTFHFGGDSTPDGTDVVTDDGDTKVTHKYDKAGEYNITITACVFEYSEERIVHVTARPCGPPAIYFPNSYTEKDPQIITRGTKIDFLKIRVEKPTDCSQGLDEPKYLWNISPSPVPAISNSVMEKASFELEPRSLDSGNYSVTLNISYNDTKITKTEEKYWFSTHFRVVSSPLVASITGGSSREVDSRSITQLELDASKSFDPDNENSELNFDWMCKFENNSVLADPGELCYSTMFVKLPGGDNQKIVTLNMSKFREDVTYVFKVTVGEGSRSDSAEQRVKLLPNIPSLEIR